MLFLSGVNVSIRLYNELIPSTWKLLKLKRHCLQLNFNSLLLLSGYRNKMFSMYVNHHLFISQLCYSQQITIQEVLTGLRMGSKIAAALWND